MKNKKYLVFVLIILGTLILSCGSKGEKAKQGTETKTEKKDKTKYSFELSDEDLATAHSKFQTEIVDNSFQGDGKPMTPPKNKFLLVNYEAKDGKMDAFLTPDPKDGKKHPAVIWLIGGYGGIGNDDYFWADQPAENDQTGRAFRDAGIVMMVPSFRGENANPGIYDMFYGEIEDLESAREYLSKISYVDPERIYVVGHSTGGTRALLGNEYSRGFRAAFSLGGIPDLELRLKGSMRVAIPFNTKNPEELKVRSPRTYMKSLQSPTFYFEGEEDYWFEFDEMKKIAKENNIPLYIYDIKGGDHFNIITPVTKIIAEKILNDTGEKANITFTKEDIAKIENSLK
ncbi:prolyl oligopeptidase family serine peptidase [Sebaldella sp. S0638]|uniref:alpha/beta hydrolase family protein n=1 Tax=Sebaldella sp. S0638 TaxID=2957809 RepID=UPI00209DA0F0|nr:prolyl oligopeptidase family serine peptidase [Sebaldella sp. S0638]